MDQLDAGLDREVQAIWESEQARRGAALIGDRLFSFRSISGNHIVGGFVEYRLLLAQRVKPDLFAHLRVRPLAVSGLLRCAEGIVFGKRHGAMTQDAGRWELVPSGGISPRCMTADRIIDPECQLLTELHEEIGLEVDAVESISTFCLIEDDQSHVLDIGMEILTSLDGDAIQRVFRDCGADEYTEIKIVTADQMASFLSRMEGRMVEVSLLLLRERGLVPAD